MAENGEQVYGGQLHEDLPVEILQADEVGAGGGAEHGGEGPGRDAAERGQAEERDRSPIRGGGEQSGAGGERGGRRGGYVGASFVNPHVSFQGGLGHEAMEDWLHLQARHRLPPPESVEEHVLIPNRRRLTWQECCEIYRENGFNNFALMSITFEDIDAHLLTPDEDWEQALQTHCKIALHPDYVYHINRTVTTTNPAYIIGNGARVIVNCALAFNFKNAVYVPDILNMGNCTIVDVMFETGNETANYSAIRATRGLVIHGCTFIGLLGTCVVSENVVYARGCTFLSCYLAIRHCGFFRSTVRNCYFEKCIMAIVGQGEIVAKNNTSLGCHTFIIVGDRAKICGNTVVGVRNDSSMRSVRMSTCLGGHVRRMYSIHIAANRRRPVPEFNDNSLHRVTMFLGFRRGNFSPQRSNFSFSILLVERSMRDHLFLRHAFVGFFAVRMIVGNVIESELAQEEIRALPCHCERHHFVPRQRVRDISGYCLPHRRIHSCDTGDYSSSEEVSDVFINLV